MFSLHFVGAVVMNYPLMNRDEGGFNVGTKRMTDTPQLGSFVNVIVVHGNYYV